MLRQNEWCYSEINSIIAHTPHHMLFSAHYRITEMITETHMAESGITIAMIDVMTLHQSTTETGDLDLEDGIKYFNTNSIQTHSEPTIMEK